MNQAKETGPSEEIFARMKSMRVGLLDTVIKLNARRSTVRAGLANAQRSMCPGLGHRAGRHLVETLKVERWTLNVSAVLPPFLSLCRLPPKLPPAPSRTREVA